MNFIALRLFSQQEHNDVLFSTKTRPSGTGIAKQELTQREYFIAIRNRLFFIEEQIWLYDYVKAHPKAPKVFLIIYLYCRGGGGGGRKREH